MLDEDSRGAKVRNVTLVDGGGQATVHLDRLRELFDHKSYGPYNILSDKSNVPAGLSSRKIWDILQGKNIKLMRKDHFEYLIEEFTVTAENYNIISHSRKEPSLFLLESGVETEYLKKMRILKKSKGVSTNKLLVGRTEIPAGLTPTKLDKYLQGRVEEIPLDHFQYVVDLWESLPDFGKNIAYVQLIDNDGNDTEVLREIKENHERTAVGADSLLKNRKDIPNGLTQTKIANWLQGKTRYAQRDYIQYVSDLWRDIADADEIISITPELRKQLINLAEDTKIKPPTFIKEMKGKAPEDLKSYIIAGWLNGEKKTAKRKHIEYFLSELESLLKKRKRFIKISQEVRDNLLFHKKRTGLSPKSLLCTQKDLPDGFIKGWVGGWLSGRINMAEEDHLNYVLRKWSELPDRIGYFRNKKKVVTHGNVPVVRGDAPNKQEVTDEVRRLLKLKLGRNSITIKSFLRRFSPVPDGLTMNHISRWMCGTVKTADKIHLNFVLDKLKEIPDVQRDSNQNNEVVNKSPSRILRATINDKNIQEMKDHQMRTGIGSISLLKNAKDIPDGLSASMVSSWINGYVQTASPIHVKYVLKLWRKVPDKV